MSTVVTREKGSLSTIKGVKSPCQDCTVLKGRITLEYTNGTIANPKTGVYLHHAVAMDLSGKKQHAMVCPGHMAKIPKGPAFFLGGAADTDTALYTTSDGQFKSGYYVKPKARMAMMAELMNYSPEQQTVYIVAEAEYFPSMPEGYLDSLAIPISVNDCLRTEFKVKTPLYSKASGDYNIGGDSYIVNMGMLLYLFMYGKNQLTR
jgi:hypothetical protein